MLCSKPFPRYSRGRRFARMSRIGHGRARLWVRQIGDREGTAIVFEKNLLTSKQRS
jgi:hypothetical protein